MLTKPSHLVRVCATAVALLVSAGCGNRPTADRSADAGQTSTPPVITGATLSPEMPLAVFLENQVRLTAQISAATSSAIDDCMALAGHARSGTASSLAAEPSAASSRYGLTDRTEAIERGYHGGAAGDSDLGTPEPVDDAEYNHALYGDKPIASRDIAGLSGEVTLQARILGGCTGTATLSVFGTADDYFAFREVTYLLEDLANASWEQLQEAPEFRALNADWAECMARHGLTTYSSPIEPINEAWEGKPVTATETDTALVDVTCKEAVNYVARASSIEGDIQSRILSTRPGLLTNYEAAMATLVSRLG